MSVKAPTVTHGKVPALIYTSISGKKPTNLKKGDTIRWIESDGDGKTYSGKVLKVNGSGEDMNVKVELDTGRRIWRSGSILFPEKKKTKATTAASMKAPALMCGKSSADKSTEQSVDLDNIPWHKVVQISCSSSGTAGVVYVEFDVAKKKTKETSNTTADEEGRDAKKKQERRIVVLKCDPSLSQEIYATELAISVGLKTVNHRVISYNDPKTAAEYTTMISVLRRSDTRTETGLKVHKRFLKGTGLVMAMEFIPQPVKIHSCPKNVFDMAHSSSGGARRLRKLGTLIALDAFINNMDRVPVVCRNGGNSGNLIFSHGGQGIKSELIAIDQVINGLDVGGGCRQIVKNFETHRDRVVLLFCEAVVMSRRLSSEEDASTRLPLLECQRDTLSESERSDGWGWAPVLLSDTLMRGLGAEVHALSSSALPISPDLIREACLLRSCDAARTFFGQERNLAYLKRRLEERKRGRSVQELDRVRDFLACEMGRDIGDEGLRLVAQGVCEFFERLLRDSKVDRSTTTPSAKTSSKEEEERDGASPDKAACVFESSFVSSLKAVLQKRYSNMKFSEKNVSDAYLRKMYNACAEVANCTDRSSVLQVAARLRTKMCTKSLIRLTSRFSGKWTLDKERSSSAGEIQEFTAALGIGWFKRKAASMAHFDKVIELKGLSWVEKTTATIITKTQTLPLDGTPIEIEDENIGCKARITTRMMRRGDIGYLKDVCVCSMITYIGKGLRQRVERVLCDGGRTYKVTLALIREGKEKEGPRIVRVFRRV
eukprot:g487.t1